MNPWISIIVFSCACSAFAGSQVAALYYKAVIADMQSQGLHEAEEARKRNRVIETMQLELSGVVSERDAARRKKAKELEKEVVRDVIRYVQSPAVQHCDLDPEWVRVHNSAASGGMPENAETTGPANGPASDTEALIAVTENYATCHGVRGQLIGLQEWAQGIGGIE